MTQIASPLSTAQPTIPLSSPTQLGKFPGLRMHFGSISAFQSAVTVEQSNVAASNPLWADMQPMSASSEPPDVYRLWSASNNHARMVMIRPGLTVTLGADTNVVLAATGIPSSGTGNNGDISIDFTGPGVVYQKTSGAWASSVAAIFPAPAAASSALKTSLIAPTTNDDFVGATVKVANASASFTKWQAVSVNGSSQTILASASGALAFGLLVADVASGALSEFLIQGIARHDGWSWTPGGAIWLSTTSGALTQVEPTASGNVSQNIGFAISPSLILVNIGQSFNFTAS